MSDATRLVVLGSSVCLAMMFLLWLLHLRMRNAAVVDVGWTAGLGILAVLYAWLGPGWPIRRALVWILGGLWSWRLAANLAHRVANEPEDGRYQELRARWDGNTKLKFLFFFLFQGVIDVVLSVPFLAASVNEKPAISPYYFFEWLVWCAFFVFALGSPWGWLAIICPVSMLYLLLRVTGIPATKKHAVRSRGEEYREYQRTTSAFVPVPRKATRR